jgi:uncharacterized membrane protein
MTIRKALFPIAGLFIVVNFICVFFYAWLTSLDVDVKILRTGNIIVFCLTLVSFYMLYKGLKAKSTTGFLSSVYGSFIIKLVIAGIIVVVYSKASNGNMNMPAVFACMFLYLFYMFIELRGLLLFVKNK